MPIYVHICPVCGTSVEVRTSFGSPPPEHCGCPMRRVFTAPTIIVYHGAADYIAQAERGDIAVPGMSHGQVQAAVADWRSTGRRKQHPRKR